MFKFPEFVPRPKPESAGKAFEARGRRRLLDLVRRMEERRELPRSFAQGLEGLKPARRELRDSSYEMRVSSTSGIESVEGMDKLGIRENQLEELMACLPGKSLGKVGFADKVDVSPDPTREGKKVFSAVRHDREGKVELSIFSSENYGGHERARGLMIDEFPNELLRAHAKANKYSEDQGTARAVEIFLKDKIPAGLASGQVEEKKDQAWETLVCLAAHAPVSEDLDWSESFKLSLMSTHGLPKQDAEQVALAMAGFFGTDPNQAVPAFQEKEKDLKRAMRLFELSETLSKVKIPVISGFRDEIDNPEILHGFASALDGKIKFFILEKQKSVLSRCIELANGAGFARKEAEMDGDNFPETMTFVRTAALSLSAGWNELFDKHKEEVRSALVQAWHQAMTRHQP